MSLRDGELAGRADERGGALAGPRGRWPGHVAGPRGRRGERMDGSGKLLSSALHAANYEGINDSATPKALCQERIKGIGGELLYAAKHCNSGIKKETA